MATNKGLYVPIEVEFSVQSKSETIVTFDRNKVMLPVEYVKKHAILLIVTIIFFQKNFKEME